MNAWRQAGIRDLHIIGCSFHYGRSLLRNVKRHSLWQLYTANSAFRNYISGLRILPLLHPLIARTVYDRFLRAGPRFMDDDADDIREQHGEHIERFRQYYESTYHKESARFPITEWRWGNHIDGARTTNYSEGFHHYLQQCVRNLKTQLCTQTFAGHNRLTRAVVIRFGTTGYVRLSHSWPSTHARLRTAAICCQNSCIAVCTLG